MTSQEQWNDVYEIAEEMYRFNAPKKRTDLDLYSQIVCARYETIFNYDPYKDEYSFRNQALSYANPVASKIRKIAEVDLEVLKNNTLEAKLETPCYMNMTPIFGIAPSTILVFANSSPRAVGLSLALEQFSPKLVARPTEMDIQPGSDFIYRHRDGRCFRVIILKETDEKPSSDVERKYEAAFLDVCQVSILKLRHLFMPIPELSLQKYPCALYCARFRGIDLMRAGYLSTWNEDISKAYKAERKTGLCAHVYKTDSEERKIVVDFPSFCGMACTESEYLKTVRGHYSTSDKDPIGHNYEQLMEKVLDPLENEKQKKEEQGVMLNGDTKPDDVELVTVVAESECPVGKASIDKMFNQLVAGEFENSNRNSNSSRLSFYHERETEENSNQDLNQRPLSRTVSSPKMNENRKFSDTISISSYRSADVTPPPTFDVPALDNFTPTKHNIRKYANEGSIDGNGDDTPKTSPQEHQILPRKDFVYDGSPVEAKCRSAAFLSKSLDYGHEVLKSPETTTDTVGLCYENEKKETHNNSIDHLPTVAQNCEVEDFVDKPPIIRTETNGSSHSIKTVKEKKKDEIFPTEQDDEYVSPFASPGKEEESTELSIDSKFAEKMKIGVFEGISESCEALSSDIETVKMTSTTKQSLSSTNRIFMSDAQSNLCGISDNDDWEDDPQEEREKLNKTFVIDTFEKIDDHVDPRISEGTKQDDVKNEDSVEEMLLNIVEISSEELSNKSTCQSDIHDLEDEGKNEAETVDEFADVADALKKLAETFLESIRIAALNKNYQSYNTDIFIMKGIALKSTGNTEQRFWKSKIELAITLEPAFD